MLAGEGAGDGFAVAECEEPAADGGSFCGCGVGCDGHRRGKGVGETVVAEDAGDFFDEIDFALEVETPGWGVGPGRGLRSLQSGCSRGR